MDKSFQNDIVIGIDVGSNRKGFHAVALKGGCYLNKFNSLEAKKVLEWCRGNCANVIGIDAPCRWSASREGKGSARKAECELAQKGISCFATPNKEKAENNLGFYGWMINGARLYQVIEADYPLFAGGNAPLGPTCFETFPQAVACALAGKVVSAKNKCTVRRRLLCQAGINTEPLTNIDFVDAALCALAAHRFQIGKFNIFGEKKDGFIVVPRWSQKYINM
ncbi:MAG: hypothetical protein CSYNP_03641 [Syntrophus sp. SKADARSKE-3]|nr:hypothetical protein [Syntrophus sp. SKADARSKE-3]